MKTVIGKNMLSKVVLITAAGIILAPSASLACACGCGVFTVGTSAILPTSEGGKAFFEYDFMDQNRNWNGTSSAPERDNNDKEIKTTFYTIGAQYMFTRAWGMSASLPFADRYFTTTDEDTGDIVKYHHAALGDLCVRGIYSGFSPDMSSGVTLGLKLPTGPFDLSGFDRDTQIGMGSSDVLLGAYHMGHIVENLNWYANGELDQPVLIQDNYRPGSELDAVVGLYLGGISIGNVNITPLGQVVGSFRLHDQDSASDPDNTGYSRILLSPGLEIKVGGFRIYGDIGFTVFDYVRGDQLVAQELYKVNASYDF